VPLGDPAYVAYHDTEWGVPSHDDRHLFEMLVLEGAQAGLSWATILHRRAGYRRAFADFDLDAVAGFTPADVERLVADRGIVRHRGKIEAAIANAAAAAAARDRCGSLDAYLWGLVPAAPMRGDWPTTAEIPAQTGESRALSAALRRDGFRFVGPTTCYAFMQAVGMCDDHTRSCFRHAVAAV
jgi:DNA-3-methyladenine glycosylase I